MTLIQGTITGLSGARQVIQGLIGLHVSTEVNAKALDLQNIILAAQEKAFAAHAQQSEMLDEIRALKEEVIRISAWNEQKQRYGLTTAGEGAFVYALKSESKDTEPAHWICTKCYEDGKKSILQSGEVHMRRRIYNCARCKASIQTSGAGAAYL